MFGPMYIRFTVCVFRGRLCTFVCPSFPFGIKGTMWDVIVLIRDHCLSIYFNRFGLRGKQKTKNFSIMSVIMLRSLFRL